MDTTIKKLTQEVQKFRQMPEKLRNAGFDVEVFDELAFALKGTKAAQPYSDKKEYQYFLSALVHGNEVGGVSLLNFFAENLMVKMEKNFHSYVFCLGNLAAAQQGKRFIERDLNRSFLSPTQTKHEEKLAVRIGNLAKKCSFSLDLHQTNQDSVQPFMIFVYSEDRMSWARHLDPTIPIITSVKERHKDGSTLDFFCFKNDTINITLELGLVGFHHRQEVFGLNFLNQTLKTVPQFKKAPFKNVYCIKETIYWEEQPIFLNPGFMNFSPIQKGAVVGKIGGAEYKSPHSGVILFPKYGEIAKNTREVFTVANQIQGLEDLEG